MEKIIGGEFEFLDNVPIVQKQPLMDDYVMYSSGRAALYQILKYAMNKGLADCIYLPDYICDSVYHVCDYIHLPYKFYPVNDNLPVDINELGKVYVGGAI